MFSVAVCPGLSVRGSASPEMLNPVPATEPELMVSAAVPVDWIDTDCVAVEFSVTSPKLTLVEAMVHAGEAALSCSEAASFTPPAVAVMVAVCVVLTAETVAVKGAVVAPAATVTEVGTLTAELLLARATANPSLGAAADNEIAQASEAAPVKDPLLHERLARAGEF